MANRKLMFTNSSSNASRFLSQMFACIIILILSGDADLQAQTNKRERININTGWTFMRYTGEADKLKYDERPKVTNRNDNVVADTRANESGAGIASDSVLKKWILPTANEFIADSTKHYQRPKGLPGSDFPFVQNNFNDASWEKVSLPHDWAIGGPFYTEADAIVGGGMGRLPIQGVAWYRRKIDISAADAGKSIYLEVDGAMSYAMVWLNGHLVGGWPYGYNSFHLDLTPYIKPGKENQLAIRIDNPTNSARWYPGAGLYRSVWLTKVNPVHVAQWGTFIRSRNVSTASADIDVSVSVENKSKAGKKISVSTDIFKLEDQYKKERRQVSSFRSPLTTIAAGKKTTIETALNIKNPALWGPIFSQKANLYVAVTRLYVDNKQVDEYRTTFGIRAIDFDPVKGMLVNGVPVRMQGVNQHHDLGALGAAFNVRAAERQLEILAEMGCNAIRLAHNPPAPELLDLTDKMGFLVIDEVFDCWERGKTPLDFHLIFSDWHEADTRSFIRRDRNHPSVIAWSFGNEVGEQYTAEAGAKLAKKLHDIVKEEDDTRPATASMNYAKPDMPFSQEMDILSLNYQGEGIRDAPAYAHLRGIRTTPLYPAFQKQFPNKLIFSSETASALSSRGTYVFPVTSGNSAPVSDSTGGDPKNKFVSAYDLYTAAFGASPDKVFASQDKHPYVAGEFVWSGWDYLGEPTPYYSARSSYSGIIDLAGFKKDRFYLYQSRWRPDFPSAHILPHWTWPNRLNEVTPVHVYSSGDEAELFLNGKSVGRKKKQAFEYRFRWDDMKYEPGELKVIAYKNGKEWATDIVRTAGMAASLELSADRKTIKADGYDLSFITISVLDSKGNLVPEASTLVQFEVSGAGEFVAADNGNAADLVSFHAKERSAFNGLLVVIVKSKSGTAGTITLKATSGSLPTAQINIKSE